MNIVYRNNGILYIEIMELIYVYCTQSLYGSQSLL